MGKRKNGEVKIDRKGELMIYVIRREEEETQKSERRGSMGAGGKKAKDSRG